MKSNAVYKTRQREYLLACLVQCDEHHLTAEDLARRLRENGTPVGQSTVYRYLNVLVNEGLVRKYQLKEAGPACYQYIGSVPLCHTHYHLMCEGCGALLHAHDDMLHRVHNTLKELYGFELNGAKTVLYGQCLRCRNGQ